MSIRVKFSIYLGHISVQIVQKVKTNYIVKTSSAYMQTGKYSHQSQGSPSRSENPLSKLHPVVAVLRLKMQIRNSKHYIKVIIQGGPKKTSDCVSRFNNCSCD